jgi:hypothetical protein
MVEPNDTEDTLDLQALDQLHAVVLEFGKASQELKKLCVGLVSAVPAIIFAITDSKLDASLFVAGLVIALTFWLADSYTYFYQDKVRARMTEIANGIRSRRGLAPTPGVGMPTVGRLRRTRLVRSLFSASQLIYGLLGAVAGILWVAYSLGLLED